MKTSRLIRVYGIVQGVGFRPFVARTAKKTGIAGSVCNKGPYVEIIAEGTEAQVEDFRKRLVGEAPERSAILKVEMHDRVPSGEETFSIIKSAKVKGDIFVSPDIAICDKCKKELFDPKDRRYLHPFINCTACGPRLTILDSMPYDRVRTSMGEFPMCPACEYEYTHVSTRRYHAQPVCCNDCGPHLYLIGTDLRDGDALIRTREVIRSGGIAAVKGIGGFHLCCNAADEKAVMRLRKLKDRPMKPFAVMLKDMETVRRECITEEGQEEILDGPQKPILLLLRRTAEEQLQGSSPKLCGAVAPDNPHVGVMLPYAPVQLLLFDYPDGKPMTDCFVMTSGNPRGAPICMDDEEAVRWLSPLCDVILSNNRRIRLRADDSVMAWFGREPYMIRRSRGYAPLPFMTDFGGTHKVLAAGGELKNTFCLAAGDLYYPSPYIGDLMDLRSADALEKAAERMKNLLEIEPEAAVCDLHPRYNSSAFARAYAEKNHVPLYEVQHHWAHIASCMAENNVREKVIGVSFDGTGYGTDGTIWGGEFLLADFTDFRRLGKIQPFLQAGGDMASREGWRIAVSLLLRDIPQREKARETILALGLCDGKELKIQETMLDRRINCVVSTSAGRLFDAVSAILQIRRSSTFEGEASMALEFAAERRADGTDEAEKTVPAEKEESGEFIFRTSPLILSMAEGMLRKENPDLLAARFHRQMADLIVQGCLACRKETGIRTVALSGGVMQNLLLLDRCSTKLKEEGFTVLKHTMSPANDGGIALGQAAIAMEKMSKGEKSCV